MAIYYLGAFPIEGGGVTNKNRDIYDALTKEGVRIKKVDFNLLKRKKSILELGKLILSLMPGNRYIIGVSGVSSTSVKLVRFLSIVCHHNLKHSIYFMMGGTESRKIASDPKLVKLFCTLKQIYVEMPSMKKTMNDVGMNNISVFPNCRPRTNTLENKERNPNNAFRCVYFSFIEPMKGVDIILDVAQTLPEIQFAFYGDVAKEYKNTFLYRVNQLDNCIYYGFFKGKPSEIYKLLSTFDLLLFPTKWETEGVPGVLVESKIAGIPVIASKNSYNAEIVEDGIDGLLLNENSAESLRDTIVDLLHNNDLIQKMKYSCQYTAMKYYIDQYSGDIAKTLMGD